MLNKKYNKPLYYQKSKAAKGHETKDFKEPNVYSKHGPSRLQKKSKYNSEFETTEYDEPYIYDYETQTETFNDYDTLEYPTEESLSYRRYPRSVTEEDWTESDGTLDCDETMSECSTGTGYRGQRAYYTFEYPSQYFPEEDQVQQRKYIHNPSTKKTKRGMPPQKETEIIPYQEKVRTRNYGGKTQIPQKRNLKFREESHNSPPYRENPYHRVQQEVYLARAPVGYKAFRYQRQDVEQSSGSESETDLEEDYKGKDEGKVQKDRKDRSQFLVFAANVENNTSIFQNRKSQNPREKLLSVTEYEQSVFGDKAEEPLEININLATEDGQGSIFQQAQKNATQELIAPENIQIYSATSNHSVPMNMVSKKASKANMKSKSNSYFPVQKSYINVANSKLKPFPSNIKITLPKESKISVKSGLSKANISIKPEGSKKSVVGLDKLNSSKGSAFYSKIHNKELKEKKERKKKVMNEDSDSLLLSVINLTDDQTDELGTKSIRQQSGVIGSNSNISIKPKGSKQSISPSLVGLDKLKSPKGSESEANLQTTDKIPKKTGLGRFLSKQKKSETKFDDSKEIVSKYKSAPQIRSLLGCDPYTFIPEDYNSSTPSLKPILKTKSKDDSDKTKTYVCRNNIEKKESFVKSPDQPKDSQLYTYGLDSSVFGRYLFQAVQFFLGLTINGTVVEVLRTLNPGE